MLDGNGRVGRLLITLLTIKHNLLPTPLLYLSAFFEATRADYYKNLYNVSANGDWHEWLLYFLNGVALQAEDVLSRTERINNLIAEWHKKTHRETPQIIDAIIDSLTVTPFLTVTKIAMDMAVAYTTAQRAVKKLETLGIIRQINSGKRERASCATEILSILEEPTKISLLNQ